MTDEEYQRPLVCCTLSCRACGFSLCVQPQCFWGVQHLKVMRVVVKIMVPFWVITLNIRCRIIIGLQKGTIILTTTNEMV